MRDYKFYKNWFSFWWGVSCYEYRVGIDVSLNFKVNCDYFWKKFDESLLCFGSIYM